MYSGDENDDDDNESYHYSDDEDMNSEDYGGDGGSEDGDDDNRMVRQSSDFEFSSDGNEDTDDIEVAIENAYYNAKQLRDTSIPAAIEGFEEVVQLEQQSYSRKDPHPQQTISTTTTTNCTWCGPWSYKAIKQLVKLHLLRTFNRKEMLRQYDRLLHCIISGAVTQNVYEKSVTGLLDRVSQAVSNTSSSSTTSNTNTATPVDLLTLKQMYMSTLSVVQPSIGRCPNERLWFKTSLKLGQLLYDLNDIPQLQILIKELLKTQQPTTTTTKNPLGSTTLTSAAAATTSTDYSPMMATTGTSRYAGTHLLEIYALQIQLYSRKKDTKKLRELFDKAMRVVEGGIPHPRTLALIQEMGGKMHMASKEFEAAGKTFFQAFKSYDEAGDPNRLRCLKYLVMATMLHASTINPFDSQEARPYKDDPEILAMTNLVQAFHNNKIRDFEAILRKNEGRIMDDEFIREHLEDLLRTIRTQVIQNIIRPYTRVRLDFIARELNGIPTEEVELLLVSLILDGKLQGKIDQVQGILVKDVTCISRGNTTLVATSQATTSGSNSLVISNSSHTQKRMDAYKCDAMDQLVSSLQTMTTNLVTISSDQYLAHPFTMM